MKKILGIALLALCLGVILSAPGGPASAETSQYGILYAHVSDWDGYENLLYLETNITLQFEIWLGDGNHEVYEITPGGCVFWTGGVDRWRLYSTNPGDQLTYTDGTAQWDMDLDTEIWYRTGQLPVHITYAAASDFDTIVANTNLTNSILTLNYGEPYRFEWITSTTNSEGTIIFELAHVSVAIQVVGPSGTTYNSEDENWTVVTEDGWVEFQNVHITYTGASNWNTIVVNTDMPTTTLRLNYGEPWRTDFITATADISGTGIFELTHTSVAVQVVGPPGTIYTSQDENWVLTTDDGWMVYVHRLFLPLILH